MWKIINGTSSSKQGDNSINVMLDKKQNGLTQEKYILKNLNDFFVSMDKNLYKKFI